MTTQPASIDKLRSTVQSNVATQLSKLGVQPKPDTKVKRAA